MADFLTKKVISPVLIVAVMVQLFWFLPSKKAEAVIDLKTASSGIISAAIGCTSIKGTQEFKDLQNKIDSVSKNLDSVQTADKQTQQSSESIAFKQICLNKIERAAAQTVLKAITQQTVDYINHGFKGEPLFVRNPQSFFKSIADGEINGFANLFQDQKKYPFGRSFIKGYIGAVKRTFAQNAQYSLNQALGPNITPQQYYNDFRMGGWDAWFATTQLPQNNPYGFNIMASNELASRLRGTSQSAAQNVRDELQQGLGFLSPKICVDANFSPWPSGRTEADVRAEMLEATDLVLSNNSDGSTLEAELAAASKPFLDEIASHTCQREEVTTPGGVISHQLTTALDVPTDSLINSNDLDSSLQAIFDALLNQLFTKGLASLSGDSSSSNTQIYSNGGVGNNSSTDPTSNNSNAQNSGDQWFNQNPDIDITDLLNFDRFCGVSTSSSSNLQQRNFCYSTLSACQSAFSACTEQGFIPDQQNYIKALKDDPAVAPPALPQLTISPASTWPAPSTLYPSSNPSVPSKGQNYWLAKLIPEIYQLDYCIPGPHPGWENDARTNLVQYEGTMKDTSWLEGHPLAELYNTVTFGIFSAIENLIHKAITGQTTDESTRRKINAAYIYSFTGIQSLIDDAIGSKEQTITILDTLFDRFVNEVNNGRFAPSNMPTVTNEAYKEFRKIDAYSSLIGDNNNEITSKQSIARRLENIRNQIGILKNNLSAGVIAQDDFDQSIALIKKSFGIIASDMATEDDVNGVKSQTQQVIDEIVYVHNNLLKSTVGCETEFTTFVPWQSQTRAPYPMPHLYNYPDNTPHVGISGFNNDLPYYTFLRTTVFEGGTGGDEDVTENDIPPGDDVINISDLLNFSPVTHQDPVPVFESHLGLW